MTMPDKQNKSFFWSTVFLRELRACGVRHLVISPGSRSTPLVMAGAAHKGFRCHVVLDERSAGYVALGIGKASGSPAALICTSGTAAANFYPAVIESRESGVPLILLTADRPPILRSNGASQAIDQIKMFGDYPVFFHEAGEPVMEQADLKRLRQAAGQAFYLSISGMGPAHVNFPFRKPLEPDPEFLEKIRSENSETGKSCSRQTSIVELNDRPGLPDRLRNLIGSSARPVVISGAQSPGGVKTAEVLAGLIGAPHLSEFNSESDQYRISGFSGFLMPPLQRRKLKPDLIIRFGRQPTDKALQMFLNEHSECAHLHFGDLVEWHDPTSGVTHRINWFGKEINWGIGPQNREERSEWLESWKVMEERFRQHRAQKTEAEEQLTDGHLFYYLSRQIPAFWNLFLSNSLPVRDWMLFGNAPVSPSLFVNRGASGIDGIISSAIGTTIESGKPGILFVGDLATLHDSNALLSAKLLDHPLVVILINNGGGNIFRMLPIYEHRDLYTDYFETPQRAVFEKLARAYDAGYYRVDSLEKLKELDLKTFFTKPGIHLVECKTDSGKSMELRRRLWEHHYGEN